MKAQQLKIYRSKKDVLIKINSQNFKNKVLKKRKKEIKKLKG